MNIKDITRAMDCFVRAKGWYQPNTLRPQTAKNLAVSLCIEAAEVLELFQWSEASLDQAALEGELADVMLYLLQLAKVTGIDLENAVLNKLKINYQRNWNQDATTEREKNDEEN